MKVSELVLAISFIIAIILFIHLFPGAGLLSVVFGSLLSMLYFYFGFALFNNMPISTIFKKSSYATISTSRIIGGIAAGLVLSNLTIGILFKLMSWPGADFMLFIGLATMVVVFAIAIFKNIKSKSSYYSTIFIRLGFFGSIAALFFVTANDTLLDYKYRNHQAYLQALKNEIADPNNTLLIEKREIEYKKAFESD